MARSIRLVTYILFSFLLFAVSCKKEHGLNEYPKNSRLYNVIKKTTNGGKITTENYRFVYDGFNRVSKIYYTTTDPMGVNTIADLIYVNDTIYDTIRFVNNSVMEIDTFITDRRGNIAATYIRGKVTKYSYYDNLITRIDYDAFNYSIFNSYNNNVIRSLIQNTNTPDGYFTYYFNKNNRPGDYLYLQSMFRYGHNFYRNQNLIDSFTNFITFVKADYTIDADQKITAVEAHVTDTGKVFKLNKSEHYDLQYEKY